MKNVLADRSLCSDNLKRGSLGDCAPDPATMNNRSSLLDKYYFLWALVMPVTSVLTVPSIQGTTMGYLMCFLSVPLVLAYGKAGRARYSSFLFAALVVWTIVFLLTQLADVTAASEPDFAKIALVDGTDQGTFVMRASMFTQSIYLAAVVFYAGYIYIFYKTSWDRWLLAAGTFYALYGMFELAYFAVTGQSGDFVSNRTFGDSLGSVNPDGSVSGSLFQTTEIGGYAIARLKSLTGEPSMYSLSMLPFWIYFSGKSKSRWPVWIIGVSLILTTSSSALIGYLCYLAIRARKLQLNPVRIVVGFAALLVIGYFARHTIADFYQVLVVDKLDGRSESGVERAGLFWSSFEMWKDASLANQLFGIGFGYIRSTDMFSTLLVNTGVVGTLSFTVIMLYPAFKLDWGPEGTALRQCCVAIWAMMMISVPEFSYLAPWTFVAIAYNRLYQIRRSTQTQQWLPSNPRSTSRAHRWSR